MKNFNLKYFIFFVILTLNLNIYAKENILTLDSIDVVENSSITEGTNSYTTQSMNTATKLDLSIKDTPQTISVLTTKELDDKNIDSYDDVLRNISGIGFYNLGITNFLTYSRGFTIDYYKIDGMPYYSDNGINNFDLSIYDRVEIVKGANGLLTGEGNPAVSMNFVRKHANSKKLRGSISLDLGSWDSYYQTTDISTPLTEDKKIRARFIVKNGKAKSFQDHYKTRNNIYYAIVDGELDNTSFFSLGANYQELYRKGGMEWGLPAFYSDATKVNYSRSFSISNDRYYSNFKTKELFGSYTKYIKNDINLNFSASYKRTRLDQYSIKPFTGDIDKLTGGGVRIDQDKSKARYDEINLDSYLNVPFKISNLNQEIIFGMSYNQHKKRRNYKHGNEVASNFFTYDNGTLLDNVNYKISPKEKTKQLASYLVGRFSLSDNLKLITGLRITNWKRKVQKQAQREFNNVLTPYAGLVYKLNENHNLFFSYTDIFQTQSRKDANGDYIDPIVGENYESGIKGSYFDGKLNASLSFFRILEDNVATIKEPYTKLSDGSYVYEAKKGVLSKGVEFSIAGQISDNIDTIFSITKFEAKDAQKQKVVTRQARTTANIFVNYKLNDVFNIGAGLNYYSKTYAGSGIWYYEQKPYTLANLMAKYKINKKTSLQLNINNLFDKKYYEGIGSSTDIVYGEPRSFNASLSYKF